MKEKRNEDIFQTSLNVLNYLIYEYKKELKRTTFYNDKNYKATRKTRLRRLRLEISQVLKDIENELPYQWFTEVE